MRNLNGLLLLKNILQVIQRRFDYMFSSNTLQEFVTMTEIRTPFSADHFPVPYN